MQKRDIKSLNSFSIEFNSCKLTHQNLQAQIEHVLGTTPLYFIIYKNTKIVFNSKEPPQQFTFVWWKLPAGVRLPLAPGTTFTILDEDGNSCTGFISRDLQPKRHFFAAKKLNPDLIFTNINLEKEELTSSVTPNENLVGLPPEPIEDIYAEALARAEKGDAQNALLFLKEKDPKGFLLHAFSWANVLHTLANKKNFECLQYPNPCSSSETPLAPNLVDAASPPPLAPNLVYAASPPPLASQVLAAPKTRIKTPRRTVS